MYIIITGFQSTHPRRVWHIGTGRFNDVTGFNPHTHAGCDIFRQGYNILFQSFNPHTHAGCDCGVLHVLSWQKSFNPHTHAGCDIQHVFRLAGYLMFQSTHPRRVWQMVFFRRIWFVIVSIHTPTQGVTKITGQAEDMLDVSIHTPTQGVTILIVQWYPDTKVSIHTPTQGVTLARLISTQSWKFQSTHPRRVWQTFVPCQASCRCFNPHTHAGCDLNLLIIISRIPSFNPHTHAGCDVLYPSK